LAPKRRRFDEKIVQRAQELYNATTPAPSAAAVYDGLEREFGAQNVPSARSLQAWIAGEILTRQREDAPWSVFDKEEEPGDRRLVLEALGWLADEWLGDEEPGAPKQMPVMTRRQALWVARLRRAFPEWDVRTDVESFLALTHIAAGLQRLSDGSEDNLLTPFLAFTPWRDGGERLRAAWKAGMVELTFEAWMGAEE
jgi:hypothetical protein